MKIAHIISILVLNLILPQELLSQDSLDQSVKRDSTYFSDYSDLLAIRLYTNTKWNSLNIIREDQVLSLQPNSPTSLGAGFNYKSYGLGLAIGLPKSKESKTKYGDTKRLDLQVNAYGTKFGFDGFAQFYKGYFNANPEDFVDWNKEEFPQLPEMRIVSVGLNAFYLFNSERFSYRAAYVRNQVQLKSAGSFTLGVFGHLDIAETTSGFKPVEFPDSVGAGFDLKSFNTLAMGVNVGYLFTLVISKNFFINAGVTPGFGNQRIELETVDGQKSTKNSAAAQLSVRSAIGYETKFLYAGITGTAIWRSFKYKGYDLDLATEQFRVFVGRRFKIK